jgi:hypothetical protein
VANAVVFSLSGVLASLQVSPYSFTEAGTGKLVEGITRIASIITGYAEPVVEVRFRDEVMWSQIVHLAQFDEVALRVTARDGKVFAESIAVPVGS